MIGPAEDGRRGQTLHFALGVRVRPVECGGNDKVQILPLLLSPVWSGVGYPFIVFRTSERSITPLRMLA
jgi:hypothetical protein